MLGRGGEIIVVVEDDQPLLRSHGTDQQIRTRQRPQGTSANEAILG
jgi:hypothetical protein